VLPPVNIDPRQKAMMDALVDQEERKRSGRRFVVQVVVASLKNRLRVCV
jgi:hypothetical protein